jgi:hypothetical protein
VQLRADGRHHVSQESLQNLLEQLNSDESLLQRMEGDLNGVIQEFNLTGAEVAALATGDEDGLRRLLGADTTGFGYNPYALVTSDRFRQFSWIVYYSDTNGGNTFNTKPACFTGPC